MVFHLVKPKEESLIKLPEIGDASQRLSAWRRSRFKLLLTSPPCCGVTSYRLDNWIRLWLLGDSALPDNRSA